MDSFSTQKIAVLRFEIVADCDMLLYPVQSHTCDSWVTHLYSFRALAVSNAGRSLPPQAASPSPRDRIGPPRGHVARRRSTASRSQAAAGSLSRSLKFASLNPSSRRSASDFTPCFSKIAPCPSPWRRVLVPDSTPKVTLGRYPSARFTVIAARDFTSVLGLAVTPCFHGDFWALCRIAYDRTSRSGRDARRLRRTGNLRRVSVLHYNCTPNKS